MLEFTADADPELRRRLGYGCGRDAILDMRGVTVRCTPTRRAVCWCPNGGPRLFRKHHRGDGAVVEARWLEVLRGRGFRVPPLLFVGRAGADSVLGMAGVAGRPLDLLLATAAADGQQRRAVDYAADIVAPLVRRLHAEGLVFRDLYWQHLFAEDLAGGEPVFIDVHRVLRPRWRRQRLIVKDLAGLLASLPPGYSRSACLLFLWRYVGSRPPRSLQRAIVRKALRIRRHRPKYG